MKRITTPVIVGAAQYTQARNALPALDPLRMMAAASRLAIEDTGIGRQMVQAIDAVCVVNLFTWIYRNAPQSLCEKLPRLHCLSHAADDPYIITQGRGFVVNDRNTLFPPHLHQISHLPQTRTRPAWAGATKRKAPYKPLPLLAVMDLA